MNDSISFEEWQNICCAKARYCRYLDSKEWDNFAALFTDDLELDVSEGTDIPVIKGREEAMAMIRSSIETAKTSHQVHCPEMARDGDAILVTWAMQDRVIWGPERALSGYGHYHERWVKRDGVWKIAAQRLTRLILEM